MVNGMSDCSVVMPESCTQPGTQALLELQLVGHEAWAVLGQSWLLVNATVRVRAASVLELIHGVNEVSSSFALSTLLEFVPTSCSKHARN